MHAKPRKTHFCLQGAALYSPPQKKAGLWKRILAKFSHKDSKNRSASAPSPAKYMPSQLLRFSDKHTSSVFDSQHSDASSFRAPELDAAIRRYGQAPGVLRPHSTWPACCYHVWCMHACLPLQPQRQHGLGISYMPVLGLHCTSYVVAAAVGAHRQQQARRWHRMEGRLPSHPLHPAPP